MLTEQFFEGYVEDLWVTSWFQRCQRVTSYPIFSLHSKVGQEYRELSKSVSIIGRFKSMIIGK